MGCFVRTEAGDQTALAPDLGAVFEHDGRVTVRRDLDMLAEDMAGGWVELTCRLDPGEGGAVVVA